MLNFRKLFNPKPKGPPGDPIQAGPGGTLMAEVVYAAKTEIPGNRLREALKTILPHAHMEFTGDNTILVEHRNHPLELANADKACACTAIMLPSEGSVPKDMQSALQQTRDWEPDEALSRAAYPLLITEMFARWSEPIDRIRMFHGVVCALASVTQPTLIHPMHAERLVNPSSLAAPLSPNLWAHEMPLFFNVRLFNIQNSASQDVVMDTRGLAELGLPDIQIHCHDLPTSQLAGFLWNLASYILQNGDCIEDGHTVEGIEPGQKWLCQHEDSLLKPRRVVLDVNPGRPFAAGNRKN